KPHVTERVDYSALEHVFDRVRSNHRVFMLHYRISVDSAGSQRLTVHRDRIVDEKLDPHCGETGRGWAAGAVIWRFGGQEELGAVDRKSCDYVFTAIQMPQELGKTLSRRARRLASRLEEFIESDCRESLD